MTGVAITGALLVALVAYVLWLAWPATEAVRLRNALLLRPGRDADFGWAPPAVPPDFDVERRAAPGEFRELVDALGIPALERDWDKALALAAHLTEHAADRGPVQADLSTTYRAIRHGYGYCADYVKAYLALAHAAGLFVRQWGFSFDGFGGHGHTVVELFDRQHGRWRMLDVYNNFHFVGAERGEPLGVLECRAALAGAAPPLLRRNGPGRPGFVHEHKAFEYYRRGIDQWYLMWGNAVVTYYAHPWVAALGRVSRTLAHIAANVVGVQPRIRVYSTPANAEAVRRMLVLRRRLLGLAVAGLLLLVTLVLQLAWLSGMARWRA